MFDTAEAYAKGRSEEEMFVTYLSLWSSTLNIQFRGRVIRELGFRRSDIIITTKLFWGIRTGPNDGGLSRKQYAGVAPTNYSVTEALSNSIIEGTRDSLNRLGLEYVDVLYAHRPDRTGRSLVPKRKRKVWLLIIMKCPWKRPLGPSILWLTKDG